MLQAYNKIDIGSELTPQRTKRFDDTEKKAESGEIELPKQEEFEYDQNVDGNYSDKDDDSLKIEGVSDDNDTAQLKKILAEKKEEKKKRILDVGKEWLKGQIRATPSETYRQNKKRETGNKNAKRWDSAFQTNGHTSKSEFF